MVDITHHLDTLSALRVEHQGLPDAKLAAEPAQQEAAIKTAVLETGTGAQGTCACTPPSTTAHRKASMWWRLLLTVLLLLGPGLLRAQTVYDGLSKTAPAP